MCYNWCSLKDVTKHPTVCLLIDDDISKLLSCFENKLNNMNNLFRSMEGDFDILKDKSSGENGIFQKQYTVWTESLKNCFAMWVVIHLRLFTSKVTPI